MVEVLKRPITDYLLIGAAALGLATAMWSALGVSETVAKYDDAIAVVDGVPISRTVYDSAIEGLASDGTLHPVQEGFWEHHGLQCGYCTPGMIMAGADLLAKNPDPSESEVREALAGNLCRCTGYHNIVKAVMSAAKASDPAAGNGAGRVGVQA